MIITIIGNPFKKELFHLQACSLSIIKMANYVFCEVVSKTKLLLMSIGKNY